MAFELTRAQRLAVENTGGPLLVSAAAGAGKTRVLVERLMDRVCAGADVDRFLVITFTNAAAAELRSRVAQELSVRLAERPGDRHLRRQTTLIYQAHISTVHAFCGELLREWGHLTGLDPDYRLCDEGEGEVLRAEAMAQMMEELYEAPTPELSLLLDTFSAGRDDWGLTQMVLSVYQRLQSLPDPEGWLERQKDAFDTRGLTDGAQTPWGAYLLGRYRRKAAFWRDKLSQVLEECRTGVPGYTATLSRTVEELDALARAQCWEEARIPTFPRIGVKGKGADEALVQRVQRLWDRCKDVFRTMGERLDTPSELLFRDLRDVAPAARALLELVGRFGRSYREGKERRNVLDFNDLEHRALELLRTCPQAAETVGGRFLEVMVDEYQDTNQVQNAIFDALTAQGGQLFLVGDVKQSIYRFRQADPSIFLRKYRDFPPAEEAREGEGRRVILGENFRSRPEVIDCVNFLFENLMSEELGELDYGEAERLRVGAPDAFGGREDCAAELHVLSNPKADEEGDNTMVEPRYIARRLRRLLDEGFPVSDGNGGLRPVTPSDMAILLRAPNRVSGRYARALAEVGIPWASEGGEDYLDTPEVSVALSYLEIIDNPRQDVPLIAVLRSPVYGFSPDRLAQLRERKGTGCYYDALAADQAADSRRVMDDLLALRLAAQDQRSYELLWEVYCRTGMLALYGAMPGGEVRRAHLLGLYSCARDYDAGDHKGLFGFLTHLRRRREQGEELTLPGEAVSGVRVMSIHKSKGLEFPVVVVGGLGKGKNTKDAQEPMLFHRELGLGPQGLDGERRIRFPTLARWAVAERLEEETRSEELRVLYVALTRAREKLILVGAMKDPGREIEALLENARLPCDPEALAAQGSLLQWVLTAALCRPEAAALRQGLPLLQAPAADTRYGAAWQMVFADGETLSLPPQPQEPEGVPVEAEEAPQTLPDYRWRYPWEAACQLPSKLTATQIKGREVDREVKEGAAEPPRPVLFDRPHFALERRGLTPGERGTAHHMVMQFLDFARASDLGGIRAEIARLVDREIITPQQGEAVDPAVILAFFRSPLGEKVMSAAHLHREFKFSVLQPAERYYPELAPGETVLLQGVVDCWLDTPEGLVIVDFKSDHVTEANVLDRARAYKPQLDAYADALSELLDRPVARRALWFFSLSREVDV